MRLSVGFIGHPLVAKEVDFCGAFLLYVVFSMTWGWFGDYRNGLTKVGMT